MEHRFVAPCGLCSRVEKLEHSHIVPQFVYRWLKESAGVWSVRFGSAINQPPTHDGLTLPLLCGKCEDRFSLWESQFARDVFHPYVADKDIPVKYGPWLLKFAVSVCWRILEEGRRRNRLSHLGGQSAAALETCLRTWNDFLVGRRPDIGLQTLHLLKWNGVTGADEVTFPPRLSRYLRRTIEVDVSLDEKAAFVFAKLGPIMLFGIIRSERALEWRETKIHLEGKLKIRDVAVPSQYRDYLSRRAMRLAGLQKSGSSKHHKKISDNLSVEHEFAFDQFTATEMDYQSST